VLRARRAFVAAWILLTIAGALNQTIVPALFGDSMDLLLPHLKYGHVMFNKNPRQVQVLSYSGADGVRHDLADLLQTPAPGYARARLTVEVSLQPDYLAELCLHAWRAGRGELTFILDDYDVDRDREHPVASHQARCGEHGLLPQ
jgi:hypothetical protein